MYADQLQRIIELLIEIRDVQAQQPAALAPPTPAEFKIGQVLDVPEPPVGSLIRDREGDEWWRGQRGWSAWESGRPWSDVRRPWSDVTRYAPLLIMKVGTGE